MSAAGRGIRYGPYDSELDAQRKIAEWDIHQPRVWPLKTKDPNAAAQLIRAQQMNMGGVVLDNVLSRMRRQPPQAKPELQRNEAAQDSIRSRQVEFDDDDY